MKAEPTCTTRTELVSHANDIGNGKGSMDVRRHAISPTWPTARLAEHPSKIPKAVHICHDITRAPRMDAGLFSAANIGTVEALIPIPTPRSILVTNNCCQLRVRAPPIGVSKQKIAEMKIVPDTHLVTSPIEQGFFTNLAAQKWY